ncbi:MAG: TonB-dependent receptor plug domain-containing protein [Candidatus Azotimanducaceae bacterium WSBS_2022_MAG_OTU7]
MYRCILILFGCLSLNTFAEVTRSLVDFLQGANAAGYKILFSSALVRPYYQVTFENESPITLEQIQTALTAYELALKPTAGDSYLVVSIQRPAKAPPAEPTPNNYGRIEEVVVNASAHQFQMAHIGSSLTFGHENLSKRPAIANDALRISSRLPGSANNGVSARSSIRGGRENEMLISFNGMRLYEPFHLHQFNQLFSVVDSRTIDSIDVLTGGFPTNHGDRLSGVTVLNTIVPGSVDDSKELGIGLYTASYLQTLSFNQHNFVVNLRRSTIDLFLDASKHDLGTPTFADLHIQYQFDIDQERTVNANVLWFGDNLSINNSSNSENLDSSFSSFYTWLSYRQEPEDGPTAETKVGFTAIKDDRKGFVNKPGMVNGSLADDQEFRVYTLEHTRRYDFRNSLLNVGASYRYLDAEYGFRSVLQIDPRFSNISNFERPEIRQFKETELGQQLAVFVSYKHRLLHPLYVEAGIRLDTQDYISNGWSKQVTPRLNLLYRFASASELRVGLGKFSQSQGIHELDASDGIQFFQGPQKANHYVLSYKQSFSHLDLKFEAYRKVTDEPEFYFENLTDPLSIVPELQVDRTLVDPTRVTARGIELSVSGDWQGNEFWLNYTRAKVEESIDGNKVRRSSDQKHAANIGWSRQLHHWQLAVESTYHSGWPTSRLALDSSGNAEQIIRNDHQLPHYLTIDVKGTRQWQLNNSKLRLEFGITNLFNRDNVIGTEYEMSNSLLKESDRKALPIAPFIDLFYAF